MSKLLVKYTIILSFCLLKYGLKCHIVEIVFLIKFLVEAADQLILGLNLFSF